MGLLSHQSYLWLSLDIGVHPSLPNLSEVWKSQKSARIHVGESSQVVSLTGPETLDRNGQHTFYPLLLLYHGWIVWQCSLQDNPHGFPFAHGCRSAVVKNRHEDH